MRNLTMKLTIAAAAVMLAAGMAGAQTLKAEIPFGFRAAGTVMTAGSYRLEGNGWNGASSVFHLVNMDTHRSTMTIPILQNTGKAGAVPTLTFECNGADCALVAVALTSGETYKIAKPGLGRDENTRIAVIRAVMVNTR